MRTLKLISWLIISLTISGFSASELSRQYVFGFEPGNLLRNWSFEQRGDFWGDVAGVTSRLLAKSVGISPVTGSYIGRFDLPMPLGTWSKFSSPIFPINPSTQYTFSCYVKTNGNTGTVVPYIKFYSDNGLTALTGIPGSAYPLTTDWSLQSFSFTTPANAITAVLTLVQVQGTASTGTWYFEDVVLEPGSAASSRSRIGETMMLLNDLGQTVQADLKIAGGGNSSSSRKYLVTANRFDNSRRLNRQYSGYLASGNPVFDANYATNSTNYNDGVGGPIGKGTTGGFPYASIYYWDEPGAQPSQTYMSGSAWLNSTHIIETGEYFTSSLLVPSDIKNQTADNAERPYLLKWGKDVDGKYSLSWSNQQGQTLQNAVSNGSVWIYTKYEYFPNGNLKKVLTPMDVAGDETQQEFRQITNYNSAGEITSDYSKDRGLKKYWYNRQGQLRFSRHESQTTDEYEFTEYDFLNRPILAGLQILNPFSSSMADQRSTTSSSKTVMRGMLYDNLTAFQSRMGFPLSDIMSGKTLGVNGQGQLVCDYNLNAETKIPALAVKDRAVINFYNYNTYGEVSEAFRYIGAVKTAAQRVVKATFTYDAQHRLDVLGLFDNQSTPVQLTQHKYSYDAFGRIEKVTGLGNKNICTYAYYDWGGLKSVTLGGNGGTTTGTRLEYLYHLHGWLQEIKAIQQSTGKVFYQENLGYEKKGLDSTKIPAPPFPAFDGKITQQFSRFSNEIPASGALRLAAFKYDALQRMLSADVQKNGNANPISSSQLVDWANLSWTDTDDLDTRTNYDDLGRITQNRAGTVVADQAAYSYQAGSYRLDHVTGKLNPTSTRDASAAGTFTYDARGRMIEDKSKSLKVAYGWDDLPVEFDMEMGDSTLTETNLYDASGSRVARLFTKSRTTQYVPITSSDVDFFVPVKVAPAIENGSLNSGVFAFNLIGSGDRGVEEAYSSSGSVAWMHSDASLFGRGVVVGKVSSSSNGNRFYIKSHNGSTMRTVNETGDYTNGGESVTDYLAYGGKRDIVVGTEKVQEKFTGKEYENESGLYAFGARWMDPELGIFLTPDPANQYLNPYSYAGGDPINLVDPTGMMAEDGGHNGGCQGGCGAPSGGGGGTLTLAPAYAYSHGYSGPSDGMGPMSAAAQGFAGANMSAQWVKDGDGAEKLIFRLPQENSGEGLDPEMIAGSDDNGDEQEEDDGGFNSEPGSGMSGSDLARYGATGGLSGLGIPTLPGFQVPAPGPGLGQGQFGAGSFSVSLRANNPRPNSSSSIFWQNVSGKKHGRLDRHVVTLKGGIQPYGNVPRTHLNYTSGTGFFKYDHGLSPRGGTYLHYSAIFIRRSGGAMMALGAVTDAYSLATSSNKASEASRIAGGWAGAYYGAQYLGTQLAAYGASYGPYGIMAGGLAGSIGGGALGYWGGSLMGSLSYSAITSGVSFNIPCMGY